MKTVEGAAQVFKDGHHWLVWILNFLPSFETHPGDAVRLRNIRASGPWHNGRRLQMMNPVVLVMTVLLTLVLGILSLVIAFVAAHLPIILAMVTVLGVVASVADTTKPRYVIVDQENHEGDEVVLLRYADATDHSSLTVQV